MGQRVREGMRTQMWKGGPIVILVGALYDLSAPTETDVARPANEWNSYHIKIDYINKLTLSSFISIKNIVDIMNILFNYPEVW